MPSASNSVASSGLEAMTTSRSCRIFSIQAIVCFALARGLHGEHVVVLVLEVARFVGAQAGEGVGDGRRLQAHRRDVLEVNCVRHRQVLVLVQPSPATGDAWCTTIFQLSSSASES